LYLIIRSRKKFQKSYWSCFR